MMNKKSNNPQGFALVSTVLLMVLLAIITVGMLSLSAVTLRSSQHDMAMSQARANARMALMIAIGELQNELGPDKRINAPASQMEPGDVPAAGRRHWVGVYDSWDSTSPVDTLRPAPVFRRWLVSGETDMAKKIDAPKDVSTEDVILWQGVEPSGADRVSAPLVDIGSSDYGRWEGGFAWWVGDENSKALVKKADQENDLVKAMRGVQASGSVAFQNHPAMVGLERTDAQFDKLASYKTMDLLKKNPPAVENEPLASSKSFHDLTPFSMGVITDVARGGLKRDLSLYLDHPIDQPLAVKLPNERRLYSGGITWEELWLFHNVWRALETPHPSLQSKTGGNLANSQILMTKPGLGPASIDAFVSDPFSLYKLPTCIRLQYINSLWTKKSETDPDLYDLHIVTDGIATFWNPYDVPIALHPDSYMSLKIFGLPYNLQILGPGNSVLASKDFTAAVEGNKGRHYVSFYLGTAPASSMVHGTPLGSPDPIVLMPGEVLLVSPGMTGATPEHDSENSAVRRYRVRAGWNHARGNSVVLASGLSESSDPSDPLAPKLDLRFRAVPNGQRQNPSHEPQKSTLNTTISYGAEWVSINSHKKYITLLGGRHVQSSSGSKATDLPMLYPTVVTLTLPSLSLMSGPGGKHPVMGVTHQMKTEENPTFSMRMIRPGNNSNTIFNMNHQTSATIPRKLALTPNEIKVETLDGFKNSNVVQLSTNHINRGLFGGSFSNQNLGQDTVITVSVPREPPLSLGAFQHAIASGVTKRYAALGSTPDPDYAALDPNTSLYTQDNPTFQRMVSNSYAFPVILPNATQSSSGLDHSYHVNRMLWDSWFLSSIAQAQAPHHPNKKTAQQVYDDFIGEPSVPLPNTRMKLWAKGYEDKNSLFEEPEPHERASSKLMLEGAFNVNSTSVEAWKALFGSLQKAFVPVSKGTNSPGDVKPHQLEPELVTVPSLLTPYGDDTDQLKEAAFESAATTTAGEAAQWRGNRKLNQTEIEDLAKAMVEEVKSRGPFLSMADFVNRRPSADKQLALRGPLQAALDKTVNKDIFAAANRLGTAPNNVGYEFPEAAKLPKSMNTSAHVLQADMLTAIGPQLTVRSDTFRIRTYGEARDKNGKVLAKAWCEAVVQRVPDYVDPADPAEAADPLDPDPEPRNVPYITSPTNQKFGRRIELISFRWLHESEITL